MRLTTRGWATVAAVVLSVLLAVGFGQRSLNAVAAPALAALVVAAVQVWRADAPTVAFDAPRPGFPGQRRDVALAVEGDGLATVRQPLPPGLTARPIEATVPLPHTFERELALEARGVYDLGPPAVRQRDPLGLVARALEADATAEVVVYPQVYTLADPTLGGLLADRATAERQEFDRLREYVPGDPLRNVHWKSSAKHDEYLVMEFSPGERTETVTVAAEADDDHADRMAAAAATVALAALEAGLTVELAVPDASLPAGAGDAHRENALRLLAGADGGSVDESVRAAADVSIRAGPEGTSVRLPEGERSFESLVTGHERSRAEAEVVG
jgi:uncharacterized protein (DUF58 family)